MGQIECLKLCVDVEDKDRAESSKKASELSQALKEKWISADARQNVSPSTSYV